MTLANDVLLGEAILAAQVIGMTSRLDVVVWIIPVIGVLLLALFLRRP